jgi:hypothetical protein
MFQGEFRQDYDRKLGGASLCLKGWHSKENYMTSDFRKYNTFKSL